MREGIGEDAGDVILRTRAGGHRGLEVAPVRFIENAGHHLRLALRAFPEDKPEALEDHGERHQRSKQQRPHYGAALEEYLDHTGFKKCRILMINDYQLWASGIFVPA